jgi:bacillithiol biosynthesis cysteine-adding enzyme BshC
MQYKRLVSFQDFPFISKIIQNYSEENSSLSDFITDFPSVKSLLSQTERKNLSPEKREILVKVLRNQYQEIELSKLQQENLEKLKKETCFTLCTGHQLNLFTGPSYYIYKIASIINLCNQLKKESPNKDFIPIFWMASEDHDFEEINHFFFRENRYEFSTEQNGMVGNFSTENALKLIDQISEDFGLSLPAQKLVQLYKKAYSKKNLSEAIRYITQELFANYGLLCLDGNSVDLKKQMIPYFEKEITEFTAFNAYQNTDSKFPKEYKRQINAREINLFYLGENFRERIIPNPLNKEQVTINGKEFSSKEIIKELYDSPERFSPNVMLRPLFQEVVLPNLAYIGGGGEIAYWLLLKKTFEAFNVEFPLLILRKSVAFVSNKSMKKFEQSGFTWNDLLLSEEDIQLKKTKEEFSLPEELHSFNQELHSAFIKLSEKYPEYQEQIMAQKARNERQTKRIEKRFFRDFKDKQNIDLSAYQSIKNELFPFGKFQERQGNFSEKYILFQEEYIPALIEDANPLSKDLLVYIENP